MSDRPEQRGGVDRAERSRRIEPAPVAAAGTVYLVGVGPGDPGLMTVRALELIAAADIVLYDALIPASALAGARPDAELVDVGKRGGGDQVPQQTTDRLMLHHALAGRSVVRVKGGDPFVFGRGGEEAARLRAEGIPFEVVPGVTAGIAGPAYAGIPVTHREHASGVAFVSGHADPGEPGGRLDWAALARFPGTLVVYMGVRRLPRIVAALVDGGRSLDEPAAVIQSGTLGTQRVVTGTLATIADAAVAAGIAAPAVTVVGSVASLRDELGWFEDRPLLGRTVAVTRARAQASGLARRLRELGAEVLEAPTIRTRSLAATVPPLGEFDVVALTSPNGVRELVAALLRGGRDVRELHAATVAAVGPGTARALAGHGLRADVVPQTFTGAALAEALTEGSAAGRVERGGTWGDVVRDPAEHRRRVLLARAASAGAALPDALRAAGDEVVDLALYETLAEPLGDEARARIAAADYVTFTAASTARFLAQAGGLPAAVDGPRVVSIGPVTSAALNELGAPAAVEAQEATIDGLIAALVADVVS